MEINYERYHTEVKDFRQRLGLLSRYQLETLGTFYASFYFIARFGLLSLCQRS